MMAKLMAQLGLDGSQFSAGIDGAKQKTNKFSSEAASSFSKIRTAIMAAFAVTALFRFGQAVKEIRNYMSATGMKIVSEDDLRNLEAAAGIIESIQIRMKASATQWTAVILGGLQAAAALTGMRVERAKEKMRTQGLGGLPGAISGLVFGGNAAQAEEEAQAMAAAMGAGPKTAEQMKAEREKELATALKDISDEAELMENMDRIKKEHIEHETKMEKEIFDAKKKQMEEELDYEEFILKTQQENFEHQKEDEKKAAEIEKEKAEVRKDYAEKLKELDKPAKSEFAIAASSAARAGMYLGGSDRSQVAFKSHEIVLAERRTKLTEEMNQKLNSIDQKAGL